MARINLLPWREQLRRERQRQFAVVTGAAALLAALIVVYVHLHIGRLIEHQESRNRFLNDRIAELDRKIREIRELESTKEKLIARMNVIQSLQRSRPQIVHIFDEMVRTVPDGLYLTAAELRGTTLTLRGVAQSNARVSDYMRRLDASDWFKDPKLEVIESRLTKGRRHAVFTLRVEATSPGVGEEERDARGAAQGNDRGKRRGKEK